MKSRLWFAFCVAGLLPSRAAFADDAARANLRVDVVVNLTEAGKKIPRPTPATPAYYFPLPLGYREEGGVITQFQRTPPSPAEIEHTIAVALARQGYLVAAGATKPSLLLILSWGYISPLYVARRGSNNPFSPSGTAVLMNEPEMMQVVLGDTDFNYGSERFQNSRQVEAVRAVREPRWFIRAAAADFSAWRNQHKITLLWRAHISTPLWGHYIDEVLPQMIAEGVPLFGTETNGPTFVDKPLAPTGHVIVGTPVLKDPANPALNSAGH